MNANHSSSGFPMRRFTLLLVAPLLFTTACAEFDELEVLRAIAENSEEIPDLDPSTVADSAMSGTFALAGVAPASDYSQTGDVQLNLVGETVTASDLSGMGMKVEVENPDGTYTPCDDNGGTVRGGAPNNVVTLMLDGSGSMEFYYPEEEYGNACLTCPHDPGRQRVGAAHRFIDEIFSLAPTSRVALGEFGPDPSSGMHATVLHHDFSSDGFSILGTVDDIKGYEPLGTPLWDSLEEMLERTEDESWAVEREVEGEVRRHLVVLSDGRDSTSEWADLHSVIDQANQAGVTVYAVGLGPASASDLDSRYIDQTNTVQDLQTLARETGGFYSSVDDPARLHELFDTVAAAVADGWQTRHVKCVPRPSDALQGQTTPPASGSPVTGRISMAGGAIPFSFIAP